LLVLGAAGGVGLAAIEIGKALGARVIAAVSSDDKARAARDAGADAAVVYPLGPFDRDGRKALAQLFKEAVGPPSADVILDPVGGDYSEAGIPGFYTKTGVGTQVAEGKETKVFDGEEYVLERGIHANLSVIKGWKADETGNLIFRKTARNFNLPAATCGKVCVAEVEEIVPVGALDPDCVHLPSIYVNRLILGAPYDKKIEFKTVRQREAA
jgi:threonine dehydrogenase-like Zn-dependent dehydrogenase